MFEIRETLAASGRAVFLLHSGELLGYVATLLLSIASISLPECKFTNNVWNYQINVYL